MSKSNADVNKAFEQGKEAHNGQWTLESQHEAGAQDDNDGITRLVSYSTTIGIRRDRDGAIFRDGHRYSNTTTRHQAHHSYWEPTFSFNCVDQLMGREWYRTAHIQDYGPNDCHNAECERMRAQQREIAHLGLGVWYDGIYSRCWGLGDPQDGHGVQLPDYDNGGGWNSAVLLSFGGGPQVLCGFESGKRVEWRGRTDQLWAAILPIRVHDIKQAFEALKPRLVRDAEYQNNGKGYNIIEGLGPLGIHRQGDLYFVECATNPNVAPGRFTGPPSWAKNLDGAPLPPTEDNANHRASRVRMDWNTSGGWAFWAKGNIDHPEHPRLRLRTWHRVLRSQAVRSASAAHRNLMGRGRSAAYD